MEIQPSDEILDRFDVRVLAALGGRFNQHWLVEASGERLVLRCWAQSADDIDYELRLVTQVAALGWPVAPARDAPLELDGHFWSLARFLPGEPPAEKYSIAEQRARGRLLAEFHASLAQLRGFRQRGAWRRCEQILGDPTLDQLLTDHERTRPEEIPILRWHLDRARARAAGLRLHERPGIVVHGDFAPWNLRFEQGVFLASSILSWPTGITGSAISRWRGAASTMT